MFRNCKEQQRQRLLSKFTENDYEKVDRLMELHFKYLEEVEKDTKEDEDEEEAYLSYVYIFMIRIKTWYNINEDVVDNI